MASLSMAMMSARILICVIASMVLGMFVLPRTANSASGLGVIFLVTGLLGFGLGPILNMYLASLMARKLWVHFWAAPQ